MRSRRRSAAVDAPGAGVEKDRPASARGPGWRALHVAALALAVVLTACADNGHRSEAAANSSTSTTVADRSDAPLETTTAFRSGDDGYATFRIPAIVRAADGSLVAFSEARVASAADDGNVDLVANRSTDEGRTWGSLQVVADVDSNFIGNPSPVLDAKSGRLVLLATYKNAADKEPQILAGTGVESSREYLLTSDDAGRSWSRPTDITASVKRPEWRWYGVGPGHAFELRTGPHAGRLVAPANHSDEGQNYGAHLLLSDDGGESFTGPFADQVGLVAPVVQALLLWFDGEPAAGTRPRAGGHPTGMLLLLAPSAATERVDLRVRTSQDACVTWSDGLLVRQGPSGYSDLVTLPGQTVGVLYETGEATATERIDITTFGVGRLAP